MKSTLCHYSGNLLLGETETHFCDAIVASRHKHRDVAGAVNGRGWFTYSSKQAEHQAELKRRGSFLRLSTNPAETHNLS